MSMFANLSGRAPAAQSPASVSGGEVRTYVITGFLIVAALLGSMGVWAATTEITGAVLAGGSVVVENNSKKVQHPTGGVIGSILVKEGDAVRAGDVVVRLDATVTQANLDLVSKQLDEIEVRKTRLLAEIQNLPTMDFAPELMARRDEPHMGEIMRSEVALFQSRLSGREGQKAQLRERIEQLKQQSTGLAAQESAKTSELKLSRDELAALEVLEDKNLVSIAKITAARRTVAQLEGNLAEVVAQGAQVRARIAETELQILELDQNVKSEAGKELRDQQGKAAELSERRIAALDQLKRVEIRAPQDGIVHQMTVHTVGGVVNPGEALMLIVPNSERLVVEAKIAPQDIDQVKVGAEGRIRFSAFNQRTTPEFDAKVTRVSADLMTEGQSAQVSGQAHPPAGAVSYYMVRLELTPGALEKIKGFKLVPGMPAEIHITTETRSALSYMSKPLADQFARAFRER